MNRERNKALARRIYEELWGRGTLAIIDECFARDYVHHQASVDPHVVPAVSAVDIIGAEMFKALVRAWHAGFSDLRTSVEDQIAEGDKVVTRWISRGTQTGLWRDIAATGREMVVEGISIDRIVDGRVVETWTNWDLLGLMQQLGAMRAPTP